MKEVWDAKSSGSTVDVEIHLAFFCEPPTVKLEMVLI